MSVPTVTPLPALSVPPIPVVAATLPPATFTLPKGIRRSILDSEVDPIITGWPWFQRTPVKDGEIPKSAQDVEDKVQVIRTGAIPDNSCFYHSVAKATSKVYQDAKTIIAYGEDVKARTKYRSDLATPLLRGRQFYADNFRRDLAVWLVQPAINPETKQPYTDEEAKLYLNAQPLAIYNTMEASVRNPTDLFYTPFPTVANITRNLPRIFLPSEQKNLPSSQWVLKTDNDTQVFTWATDLVYRYYYDNEQVRQAAVRQLVDTAGLNTPDYLNGTVKPLVETMQAQLGDLFYTDEGAQLTRDAITSSTLLTPELIASTLAKTTIQLPGGAQPISIDYKTVHKLREDVRAGALKLGNEGEIERGEKPTPPDRNIWGFDYLWRVDTGINANMRTDDILVGLKFLQRDKNGFYSDPPGFKPRSKTFQVILRNYIELMRAIANKFRDIFGQKAEIGYRPYSKAYRPQIDVGTASLCGDLKLPNLPEVKAAPGEPYIMSVQEFVALLPRSIHLLPTPHFFTAEEICGMLTRDPRKGVVDPGDKAVLALPITSNYFMMDGGSWLARYNIQSGSGNTYSLRLPVLLHMLLPKVIVDPKSREVGMAKRDDAGEDDMIPIVPFAVGVNIYMLKVYGDHIDVYVAYPCKKPNAPTILVSSLGGHFEVVGTAEKSNDGPVIKTIFEPDHPLILACNEYMQRLRARKSADPNAFYATFPVSRVREAKVALPSYPDLAPLPILPGAARLPGMPSLPGLPGMPSLPGLPGMPSLPGLPNPNDDLEIAMLISTGMSQADATSLVAAQRAPVSLPPIVPGTGGLPNLPTLPVVAQPSAALLNEMGLTASQLAEIQGGPMVPIMLPSARVARAARAARRTRAGNVSFVQPVPSTLPSLPTSTLPSLPILPTSTLPSLPILPTSTLPSLPVVPSMPARAANNTAVREPTGAPSLLPPR